MSMRRPIRLLAVLAALVLSACSSPQQAINDYVASGERLLAEGDLARAGVEFRNALEIRDDVVPALWGLAQVEERQGHLDKVFGLLSKIAELDPKHRDARVKLGKLLLAAGQLDKALAQSEALLALDPGSADVRALRAAVLYKLEDLEGAVAQAQAALDKDPAHIDALIVLATERLTANDAPKAIEYLDRGLAKHDRNVAFRLIKIQALDSLGQTAEAEAVFHRLIELYPDVRPFRHALARYYLLKKREADAEEEYRDIAAANPTDTGAKLDVVSFLNTVRGREAAVAELERLIKAEPQNHALRFALAQLRTSAGDTAAAEQIYREVIGEAGTAEAGLQARNRLAALKLTVGEIAAAQGLIKEVLAADARNADALVFRASLAMDRRALDDAIADLRTVLRDEPASSRALLLLAKAHELAGSVELADEYYVRAFQAARGQPTVGMDYVRFLMKRNKLPRAEDVLTDMLAVAPNNLEVLKALGEVRLGRQDWIGAEEAAEAIAKIGDSEKLADQILGVAYAGQKRLDESIDAFKRAHEASPSSQRPMLALVRAYVRAGKTGEAEQFLNAVLATNADNAFARLTLGQVYVVAGKSVEAERAFRETIRRKPDLVPAYRNLAALYAREKRLDEALQAVEEGLKAVPGDFALRLSRAGLFELRQEWEAAIAEYEALYQEKPNSDVVANNLAAVLSEYRTDAESKKRALALAERFRRSDIAYFQDTLGWVYYQLGDTDEATGLIRKAAERAPAVPVFQYHLGMTYLAGNQQGQAKEALQRALELSAAEPLPQDDGIRQALQDLK